MEISKVFKGEFPIKGRDETCDFLITVSSDYYIIYVDENNESALVGKSEKQGVVSL